MKSSAAAEYPYKIISNCLCYDTNTAGRVLRDLKDYIYVKQQNEILSRMDQSNQIIYSNLTVYVTNTQTIRDTQKAEAIRFGFIGAGIGAGLGLIIGLIIGR